MLSFNSNRSSEFHCSFFPPIETSGEWEIGLINFTTFNSIPNIEEGYNNRLYYWDDKDEAAAAEEEAETNETVASTIVESPPPPPKKKKKGRAGVRKSDTTPMSPPPPPPVKRQRRSAPAHHTLRYIELPEGSFEFEDIRLMMKDRLSRRGVAIKLRLDKSTMRCEISSSHRLDFTPADSIGRFLGFPDADTVLEANKLYKSKLPLNISGLNVVRVTCNIAVGSYSNGVEDHILYEFYPSVDPGYRILECPANVIYLPVNSQRIHEITLKVVDENGRLVNFRGEPISIRLHLRPSRYGSRV